MTKYILEAKYYILYLNANRKLLDIAIALNRFQLKLSYA